MRDLWKTLASLLGASLLAAAAMVVSASAALSQEEDEGPLYMQSPFDRVVLTSGKHVDVQPLKLPSGGRKVPDPMPQGGELPVRPLDADNPMAEYSVPWTAIKRIDLFEDMIMQEGQRLASEGDFDAAFPYFAYLVDNNPETRGLDQTINGYLLANASAAYKANEFDRALAILGSLYERSPQSRDLAGAVDNVAGRIIQSYIDGRNYRSARTTLDVVASTFRGLDLTVVESWRSRFQQAAQKQLTEAERLTNSGDYLAARQAIEQAVGVWPELDGVAQLQSRIQSEHPVVTVGVLAKSPRTPVRRLDSHAASRGAALLAPTIAELRGYTAEGGEYRSSIGSLQLDPSGLELDIQLSDTSADGPLATSLAASALARQVVEAGDGGGSSTGDLLADIVSQVSVEYPESVRLRLARPHVRPESLLVLPISDSLANLSDRGLFDIDDYGDELVRFATKAGRRGAVAEVHEKVFADDEALVSALTRGSVDVMDRVPPWQVDRLRAVDDVVVDNYLLPTVHALVPTGRSPLTEQREFRRALCYGIDRDRFVQKVLLAGDDIPGFQTVSGPFPAGTSLSDPIRYGYNSQVKPRPYDPYMAIVLSTAAWSNLQKAQGVKEPGDAPLPTLKLGHAPDAVARTACIEIAKNLNAIGIPIEVVELSVEEMLNADELVDLRYVELATWEPVVDARRLLGGEGAVEGVSDFMTFSLDRLDAATNWNEVRSRLHEIHELASTDLPIIPLWQTANYFAYRRQLQGVSQQPVTLFQDIGNWKLEF